MESELYGKQCNRVLTRYPAAEQALSGLTFTISREPEVFDTVPGNGEYRLAKSRRAGGLGGAMIPILRIVFRVLDQDRVLLCAISAEEDAVEI